MRTGTEQEKLESVTIHAINKQPVGPDVAFSLIARIRVLKNWNVG